MISLKKLILEQKTIKLNFEFFVNIDDETGGLLTYYDDEIHEIVEEELGGKVINYKVRENRRSFGADVYVTVEIPEDKKYELKAKLDRLVHHVSTQGF